MMSVDSHFSFLHAQGNVPRLNHPMECLRLCNASGVVNGYCWHWQPLSNTSMTHMHSLKRTMHVAFEATRLPCFLQSPPLQPNLPVSSILLTPHQTQNLFKFSTQTDGLINWLVDLVFVSSLPLAVNDSSVPVEVRVGVCGCACVRV